MKKRYWILALLGVVLGAVLGTWRSHSQIDPLAELFPAEKVKGYMEGTVVRIASNLSSKSITGGAIVVAEAITPGPIPPERLGPTCLGVLKGLLQQQRNTDWICVFVAEDSALDATSNWMAVAEYHRGQVTLRGRPPTAAQLDSLRARGMPAHRPDVKEAERVNEVFEANQGLKAERWNLSQTLRGSSPGSLQRESFFRLELDSRSLSDLGKKNGMTGEQLRALVLAVTRYYWLNAGTPWQP